MGFSTGFPSTEIKNMIKNINEKEVLNYYYPNIDRFPFQICSPFREERNPSFGFYESNNKIKWKDFATGESGSILDFVMKKENKNLIEAISFIYHGLKSYNHSYNVNYKELNKYTGKDLKGKPSKVECRIRNWKPHDLEYWESYGISKKWLEYAEIYPISHKILTKNGKRYTFAAERYAYCFIERKDNIPTIKIYQPFNKKGHKWCTNNDKSVWGLWAKIPKKGNNLIIASSVKDCLNLWANTGIPSICMQGEGYAPKEKVMQELKERYKNIIVFYDNDFTKEINYGRRDSIALSERYNLKRVEIPEKWNAKDPSDLYKKYKKDVYLKILKELLEPVLYKQNQ